MLHSFPLFLLVGNIKKNCWMQKKKIKELCQFSKNSRLEIFCLSMARAVCPGQCPGLYVPDCATRSIFNSQRRFVSNFQISHLPTEDFQFSIRAHYTQGRATAEPLGRVDDFRATLFWSNGWSESDLLSWCKLVAYSLASRKPLFGCKAFVSGWQERVEELRSA